MAKIEIAVEENEFALYNYEVRSNGWFVAEGENYTTEEGAITAAHEDIREWVTRK